MPDSSDIRRLRVPQELWEAYTEIVGDGGRSSDLKAYIEWRVDNPKTPLPGKRLGPAKRTRQKGASAGASTHQVRTAADSVNFTDSAAAQVTPAKPLPRPLARPLPKAEHADGPDPD
jgi:hypothetical protein